MIGKKRQPLALKLAFEGKNYAEITRIMGLSSDTGVRDYLLTREAMRRLERMRAQMDAAIGRNGAAAVEEAVELLRDVVRGKKEDGTAVVADWADRIRAANSICDRFGYEKGKRHIAVGALSAVVSETARVRAAKASGENVAGAMRADAEELAMLFGAIEQKGAESDEVIELGREVG